MRWSPLKARRGVEGGCEVGGHWRQPLNKTHIFSNLPLFRGFKGFRASGNKVQGFGFRVE